MVRSRGQKVLSANTASSRSETNCARGRASAKFPFSLISRGMRGPAAESRGADKYCPGQASIYYARARRGFSRSFSKPENIL